MDFNERIDRKGTHSVKWEIFNPGVTENGRETIPFSIADMDFSCAPEILAALKERVDRKIFGYSLPQTEDYLSAVSGWFKNRFDWNIEPDQIRHSPGVVPALAVLLKILTNEGDGVIIQSPVYYPFSGLIKENNRALVNNALVQKNGRYEINFDELERQSGDPNNKLLILCSPHNPVGRVWTREELQKVIDICIENDVYLISDEIHCDIVRRGVTHTPVLKLTESEKVVACTSASKAFNLAGLQISNIIFNGEVIKTQWEPELIGRNGLFGANPFGIVATKTAYEKCGYWIDRLNEYIDGNLELIATYLKENLPLARYSVPDGTYFAWIDLREYGFSHKELESIMMQDAGIILDEGYIFGPEGEMWERINTACPRPLLEEGLERMSASIRSRI